MNTARVYHGGGFGGGRGFPGGGGSSSIHGYKSLIWAANITPDCNDGDVFYLIGDSAALATINAPTNPHNGQQLTFIIQNDGGGAALIAFNPADFTFPKDGYNRLINFKISPNWYSFTILRFVKDDTSGTYLFVGQQPENPVLFKDNLGNELLYGENWLLHLVQTDVQADSDLNLEVINDFNLDIANDFNKVITRDENLLLGRTKNQNITEDYNLGADGYVSIGSDDDSLSLYADDDLDITAVLDMYLEAFNDLTVEANADLTLLGQVNAILQAVTGTLQVTSAGNMAIQSTAGNVQTIANGAVNMQATTGNAGVVSLAAAMLLQAATGITLFDTSGKISVPIIASGANQGAAGAAAGELWHDTTDNTIKRGV
jgi:hypothetical protein